MISRFVLVFFAVAAIALAFWLGRESAPHAAFARTESVVDAADTSGSMEKTASPMTPSQATSPMAPAAALSGLPPRDTRVLDYFDEVLDAARAGDARAACRLGAELVRCQRHRDVAGYRRIATKASGGIGARGEVDDSTIDALAMMEEHTERLDRMCAGLEPSQLDRAFELQRIAAERGGIRERLWYATAPALNKEFFLENLPEWERYRSVAYGYMEQALAAGDPAAPSALAQVHLPQDRTLPGFRTTPLAIPDLRRHLVYRELASMLSPSELVDHPVQGMIPVGDAFTDVTEGVDMDEIRAEAESLRQRLYGDVTINADSSVSSPLGPFAGADPEEICGS